MSSDKRENSSLFRLRERRSEKTTGLLYQNLFRVLQEIESAGLCSLEFFSYIVL